MPDSVESLLDLRARTVLVTGATGTIGQSIARRLCEAGARVVCHYRTQSSVAQALVEDLANAISIQGDLTSPEGTAQTLQRLEDLGEDLNGLVNNAADQSVAALSELDQDQWQTLLQTNLSSAFSLSQWFAHQLKGKSGGIVNISSIESFDPASGHGHYATTKAGLNMLTKSFALEYGAQQVRVNSVSPGLIRRDGIEDQWPEGVAAWRDRAPLSRLGEGADVANAVLFLLSDASGWMTGTNLVVDGGMSVQSRW
ncbi:MAG: SDR family oxidoreductase [Pseudomonadota bacterium]